MQALPPNPVPSAGQDDYADLLSRLQPRGRIWNDLPGSIMAQLRVGESALMAQFSGQISQLTETESYPPTSVLLLPAWEETFGLPDPCTPLSPTIEQRQQALAARLAATGGYSIASLTAVAAIYGYEISITEFAPFRIGVNAVGQPLWSDDWGAAWQVNILWFGEIGRLAAPGSATVLECVFKRLSPPQTILIFNYVTSALDSFVLGSTPLG
jgi:uncharacterized protein YmfQ (DUF2313 family)